MKPVPEFPEETLSEIATSTFAPVVKAPPTQTPEPPVVLITFSRVTTPETLAAPPAPAKTPAV